MQNENSHMTDKNEFQGIVATALRSNWRLRAAGLKQFLRQQILSQRVAASADGKPTLLVYQMGKVGSTNMARDLQDQDPSLNVFQVHRMDADYIDRLYRRYRSNAQAPYYFSNYVGRAIRRQIIDPAQGPDVKILCAVREPISRNISHFFQDIERFTPRSPLPGSIDELISIFVEKFEHDYPEAWFEEEFLPVTGIDVLNSGFDKDAGFQLYQKGRISALVYKIEKTGSAAFKQSFQDFTGFQYQPDAKHNVGGQKHYGDLYGRFKGALSLPQEFCTAQHQSRYAQTFYCEAELEQARHKLGSQ